MRNRFQGGVQHLRSSGFRGAGALGDGGNQFAFRGHGRRSFIENWNHYAFYLRMMDLAPYFS